jgi:hypothetical protein
MNRKLGQPASHLVTGDDQVISNLQPRTCAVYLAAEDDTSSRRICGVPAAKVPRRQPRSGLIQSEHSRSGDECPGCQRAGVGTCLYFGRTVSTSYVEAAIVCVGGGDRRRYIFAACRVSEKATPEVFCAAAAKPWRGEASCRNPGQNWIANPSHQSVHLTGLSWRRTASDNLCPFW